MSPDFDSNDIKKFVNYFDKLLEEEEGNELTKAFDKLSIGMKSTGKKSKTKKSGKLRLINPKAFANCKSLVGIVLYFKHLQ